VAARRRARADPGHPAAACGIPDPVGHARPDDQALDLGWTLWAYDAVIEAQPGHDPAEFRTMEFTNRREREQAQNLCRVLAVYGGAAGILCGHAPESLACWPADAVIVSTDNALS
jgi:hypothetical protein